MEKNNKPIQEEPIPIIFLFKDKHILVQCKQGDKLSDVFEKFLKKLGERDKDKFSFFLNSHKLNQNLTIEKERINKNSMIISVKDDRVIGG